MRQVKEKLECLSKEWAEKYAEEMCFQLHKSKEENGKGVAEELQKKRKLSHSSYSSSKFGTTVAHFSKPALSPYSQAYGGLYEGDQGRGGA